MARKKQEEVKVKEKEGVVETITVGDKVYNKEDITPSVYFEYVKDLKQKFNFKEYEVIIDTTLKMLKKAKITGQTNMAKGIANQLDLAIRELNAAKAGFDIFVNRKTIEEYIGNVEGKAVKIIELNQYQREIPDEVIDKIEKATEIFDQIYIIFTDYTLKETKKVAKHRRDKDPILFGAFKNKNADDTVYVEDRLFFIADWVEEKCDLTLEQICREVNDKKGKNITYKISAPETEEEAKALLQSYKTENPDDYEMEPVSLFEKIKKKVTRKKATSEAKTTTGKKRGRPKKSEG